MFEDVGVDFVWFDGLIGVYGISFFSGYLLYNLLLYCDLNVVLVEGFNFD